MQRRRRGLKASCRWLQARAGAKSSRYLTHWDGKRSARPFRDGKGVQAKDLGFMQTYLLDLANEGRNQSPAAPCREEFTVIFRTIQQLPTPAAREQQPLEARRSRHTCKWGCLEVALDSGLVH